MTFCAPSSPPTRSVLWLVLILKISNEKFVGCVRDDFKPLNGTGNGQVNVSAVLRIQYSIADLNNQFLLVSLSFD